MIAALLALVGPVEDLRVGKEGEVVRVEIVCTEPCSASGRELEGLSLDGVADEVSVAVEAGGVRGVKVSPGRLSLRLAAAPSRWRLAACGPRRVCVDLDFAGGDDLRATLEAETGEVLSPPVCAGASTTLRADPWDLGAYRTLALCRGAEGRLAEADGLLARRLSIGPDAVSLRARDVLAAADPGWSRATPRLPRP